MSPWTNDRLSDEPVEDAIEEEDGDGPSSEVAVEGTESEPADGCCC